MSAENVVARRYARALVASLVNGKTQDELMHELKLFDGLMADVDGPFYKAMTYPGFSPEEKMVLIDQICKKENLHELVRNAVKLLVKKGRISIFRLIFKAYVKEFDFRAGRTRATLTSARPLAASAQEAIKKSLEKKLSKQVLITTKVDPELLGGVMAYVEGMVFDATLQSQLSRLCRQIEATPIS